MAIETQYRRLSIPDIRSAPKTPAPLRLKEMGLLHDVFSFLAEKRGVSVEYFTDSTARGGRAGIERSSVVQELIEWNEGVPIGATDQEIAAVIKRDRTTVVNQRKRLRERQEKNLLRATVRNVLDKFVEES